MSVAFNAASYLAANPDLVTAGITESNAFSHFANSGASEGRLLSFDATAYRTANPDLASLTDTQAAAHYTSFVVFGSEARLLSVTDYKAANPDLAGLTDAQAVAHFFEVGRVSETSRLTTFEADAYLAGNADLVAAGVTTATALTHYLTFGISEGRQFFNGEAYLAANQDLGIAGVDPETHYLTFGAAEGRTFTLEAAPTIGGLANSAPVAVADAVVGVPGAATIITSSGALLANDTDANGDTLTITGVSNATGGDVGLVGSNVVFAPASGSTSGSYTYTVSDGKGGVATGAVSVVVNAAPSAVAFAGSALEDATATGTLTGADTEGDALTFALVASSATGGTAVVNSDGTFTFTPNANFNGNASFQFTANDANSASVAQTATIAYTPVNDAPVSVAGATATVVAGNTLSIDLNSFASDPDGDTLTFTPGTPSNGTVVAGTSGIVTYTVTAGQAANDTLTFTAADATASVAGSVPIVVTNTTPVAVADSASSVLVGQATTISVLSNDSDADITAGAAQTLRVSAVSQPSSGVAEVSADGLSVTFTPSAAGTATFTYTVTDGFGATASASVSVDAIIQTGGTSGADTLIGSTAAETLSGAAGNDLIDGGGGADVIDGGADDDTITIRGAESSASGGTGVDTMVLLPTTSTVQVIDFTGGAGGDLIVQIAGANQAASLTTETNNGNMNQSNLDGDGVSGELNGQDGPTLQAFENLSATGSSVSFLVRGGANTTTITTGDGADTIIGGSAASTINAGGGNDTVGAGGTATVYIDGGAGNDVLSGGSSADTILGGTGNDTIYGLTGSDSLVGGDGNDVFVLQLTDIGASADTIVGGSGTDVLAFSAASASAFVLSAGNFANISTVETLQFGEASATSLTLTDALYTAFGVTSLNVIDSDIISDGGGSAGALNVIGTSLTTANSVSVTSGNNGANDSLEGGAGNDTFTFANVGGTALATVASILDANDDVDGNGGTDYLIFNASSFSAGTITLGASVVAIENIVITGSGGAMGLTTNNANLETGQTLTVDASSQTNAFTFDGSAESGFGVYSVTGGAGNDVFTGGSSADTLVGGAGNDTFVVVSADSLVGGTGDDVFRVDSDARLTTATTIVGGANSATTGDAILFNATASASSFNISAGAFQNASGIETLLFGESSSSTVTLTDTTFTNLGLTSVSIVDTDNISNGGGSGGALNVIGTSLTTANSISVTTGNNGANDSFEGGAGNDTFTFANVGGTASATVAAIIDANDDVDGNGGTDYLIFNANSFSAGTITLGASVVAIENIVITGSGGAMGLTTNDANLATGQTLTVDASSQNLAFTFDGSAEAGFGVYSVTGGAGNDVFTGGASADTLVGGAGNDTFVVVGADSLVGGDGDDLFRVDSDARLTTATTIVGGANTATTADALFFNATASASSFNISAGAFQNVTGIETLLFGESSSSTITLSDTTFTNLGLTSLSIIDTDSIANGGGSGGALNVIGTTLTTANSIAVTSGNYANDSFEGGAGNDTFTFFNETAVTGYAVVFDANDDVDGNGGTDTLIFNTNSFSAGTITLGASVVAIENILITGSGGALTLTTNDANVGTSASLAVSVNSSFTNAFTFNGAAEVTSGATFNVTSGAGADSLTGGSGADTLLGGAGNDTILGGASADSIVGGDGADSLVGGAGADTLTGGAGNDSFSFTGNTTSSPSNSTTADRITDFSASADEIVLILPDVAGANYNLTDAGDATDAANGIANLSSSQGEFLFLTGSGQLAIDVDGNGLVQAQDLIINVTGFTGFNRSDVQYVVGLSGSTAFAVTNLIAVASVFTVGANISSQIITGATAGDVLDFSTVAGVITAFSGAAAGENPSDTLASAFTAGATQTAAGSAAGVFMFDSATDQLYLAAAGGNSYTVQLAGFDGTVTNNGNGFFTLS